MEHIIQNLGAYVSIYAFIVFFIPWLFFSYWVIKFHFAVKKVMGEKYTPWAAIRYSAYYASENKEFGEVFTKRNKAFVTVTVAWLVGFVFLFGFIFLINYYKN